MIVAARDWPSLLVEWMHQKRLEAKHLHADETKLQVMNETSRKNTTNFYMWVYETGKHGIRPSVALTYAINKKRSLMNYLLDAYVYDQRYRIFMVAYLFLIRCLWYFPKFKVSTELSASNS